MKHQQDLLAVQTTLNEAVQTVGAAVMVPGRNIRHQLYVSVRTSLAAALDQLDAAEAADQDEPPASE